LNTFVQFIEKHDASISGDQEFLSNLRVTSLLTFTRYPIFQVGDLHAPQNEKRHRNHTESGAGLPLDSDL
jgi:hypothetical protein